jgi:pimeloyl-ACP methyl ester carboxylesterase
MKQLPKILGIAALALALLLVAAWVFVVPPELKTLVSFSLWRGSHLRAAGSVDREPAGTRIHWEEYGRADGPPVIVLHGGLCSIEFMGGQIQALANAGNRVIAIDTRGCGRSTDTAAAMTYEMLTDDAIAVMDDRKIGRADVVGWSDGGNVGLDLARRYPDRVRRLVAFGANHTPPPDGADPKMTQSFRDAKPDVGEFAPLRYLYEKNSPTPGRWATLFEHEKAMAFSGPNWSLAQLATIHAPVLLENGEHDLVLLPYATEMKNAIPGARLLIVHGLGHELPLRPAQANPPMLAFLRQ